MKPLLLALLLPISAMCQKIDADTLSFNYTGVVQVDSIPAKTLQSRAKLFIAESFKSAKDVIQLDDADAGVIVVKGNIAPVIKVPIIGRMQYGWVHFTAKIQVKDGKYKYTFSEFDHESHETNQGSGGDLGRKKPACGTFTMSEGQWRQIKGYANDRAIALAGQLEKSMRSAKIGKKDEF